MPSVFRVDEIQELPPELEAQFAKAIREGVYYRRSRGGGVKRMGWRPGEPNALAAAIITSVHERMELEIDGHKYWIEPQ